MINADCIVLNEKVWVGGGDLYNDSNRLFVSSTDLESWEVLTTPTYQFSLTTYNSELVVVGGKKAGTDQLSNKLWTLNGRNDWDQSLPSMSIKRFFSSVINTGTPEYLVVAGGIGEDGSALEIVEAYIDEQWSAILPMPRKCFRMKSALHNGSLYFMGGKGQGGKAYCCDMRSIFSLSEWSQFEVPSEYSYPLSFGQQLIVFSGNGKLYVHSSISDSWVHVGSILPYHEFYSVGPPPVVLRDKQLMVVMEGHDHSGDDRSPVFMASLTSKRTIMSVTVSLSLSAYSQ